MSNLGLNQKKKRERRGRRMRSIKKTSIYMYLEHHLLSILFNFIICVPLFTYAIEVVHVINTDERRQLRVTYNSLFRKLFGYRWSESVTALQHFLSRPTWEELVEKRKRSFLQRLRLCPVDSLPRVISP